MRNFAIYIKIDNEYHNQQSKIKKFVVYLTFINSNFAILDDII